MPRFDNGSTSLHLHTLFIYQKFQEALRFLRVSFFVTPTLNSKLLADRHRLPRYSSMFPKKEFYKKSRALPCNLSHRLIYIALRRSMKQASKIFFQKKCSKVHQRKPIGQSGLHEPRRIRFHRVASHIRTTGKPFTLYPGF